LQILSNPLSIGHETAIGERSADAVDISPGQAKPHHCIVRVHMEANANDGATFSAPARSQFSGKT
jgi:hypothetical protein